MFIASQLVLEVLWEGGQSLTQYPCHSWNTKLISWTMLVAHWLYIASATMGLFALLIDRVFQAAMEIVHHRKNLARSAIGATRCRSWR